MILYETAKQMNKFQSIATAIFATSIAAFSLSGQAKFGAVILAFAMIAGVMTVLWGLSKDARRYKLYALESE